MRIIVIFLLSVITANLLAQTSEDFEDGNFGDGSPLTWTASQTTGGDDFVITSGEVQSNGPAATGDLYLATNLGIDFANNDVVWTFKLRYDGGAPSGSNRIELYLLSDVIDVSGSPQGYYIGMGESGSGDGIDFFKTNSGTALISDAGDQVGSGIDVHIRLTRTSAGMWTLEADATGGDTFSTIGSVLDTDFTSGNFFGLYVQHTSTRADDFFMDDVTITVTPLADSNPPTVQSVVAISDTEVDITFNEDVDETTAETSGNYTLDGELTVAGVMRDDTDNSVVHLTTSTMTNGETYTVTVNNLEDLSANAIAANSQDSYQYLIFEEAVEFDVVVNEFMADPNPVVGLPDAEYVELYNRSTKFFDLENWTLDGQSLTSFQFDPDSYLIICEDDDVALFAAFTNLLTVGTLSLNNSSADMITLLDDNAAEIHSISFEGSTGGTSSELINPNGPDYSQNNYGLSTDASGGTPEAQNSIFDDTPDTTPPTITGIEVVSSTELTLTFDEPLDETTSETSTNYTVDGGISVSTAIRNAGNNSIVNLTVSTLVSGDTRTLTINNVEDLSGNAIVANSTIDFEYIETETAAAGDVLVNEFYAIPSDESVIPNAEFIELLNVSNKFIDLENWTFSDATGTSSVFGSYILRPDEYVILTTVGEGTSFDTYGDVLEIGNFRSLNNSGDDITITNGSATDIYSITYTSATSGVSTELINPNGPDFSLNNYGESTNADGGTPGSQNSIFDDTPDTTPPTITGIEVVSDTELMLTFSEPLEETSSETLANYSIDGGITVSATFGNASDNSIVNLTVSTLVSGEIRTLIINGVEDLSGNAIAANSTTNFEYIETETAVAGDVLVNEFYAIPSDESVIPNAEFIELLNVSDKFIDLENWTFSDATGTSSVFGSHILRPDEYVILTTVGEGTAFGSYGDVLEVGNFRSLNNSGDDITITNETATDIYSITYTSATSGVSTELINPNGPDFSLNNYGASTNADGGTPGSQNSIFDDTPDTTLPTITGIEVVSSTELTLTFDEPLAQTSSETLGNYSINGGITVSAAVRNAGNNSIVNLTVSTLVSGDTRTLTINSVEDLSGNAIVANSTTNFEYIETETSVAGDVLVNEFYAIPSDESVIPNVEFIELLNVSDKFIELENWTFSDATGTSSAFSSHILRPDEYVILTTVGEGTSFDTYGDVLEIGNFRSLNNSGDDITITNGSATDIYSITYTSATSGVSTELINPNGPDFSLNNYGESTNADGGTPGSQNSIFDDTPDTTPPTITGIEVVSSTELTLTFDEPLAQTSSETLGNYSINGGITVSAAIRNASDNSIVNLTVSTLVSGEIRTLIINGVEDLSGNAIAANSTTNFEYIETETAVAADVLVNEFYAIPSDESVIPNAEFIELLNVSDKFIDLENWTFSDATGTSSVFGSHILRPDEYVILTTVGEGTSFDTYGDVLEIGNFRSLNNSGDDITITNETATDIYSITYTLATSGVSTELINPNGPDFSLNNYGESTNADGGTPGSQNSIFDDTPDTTPPTITGIEVVSSTELTLSLDEPLEESTSETLANYGIDGGISVSTAVRNASNNSIVSLTVSTLVSGDTRTLTINNVEDLSGNAIAVNSTVDFEYIETETTVAGDVLVNEFYAIPSDESVIPNAEFIELLNVSDKFIDLENWTFSDATGTSSEFGSHILRPDEYVILTTTGEGTSFDSYGDVLEIGNFRSLNNNGDDITITNETATDIYSITYTLATSGVSTELINPNGPDFSLNSYGQSTNADGGTPGSQNSIFDDTPDTTPPTITGIEVVSSTELTLSFDEPLEETSAEISANYTIDGGIEVTDATRSGDAEVTLITSSLVSGDTRTLTINNVEDLSGNEIATNSTIDFEYLETQIAENGDVVLNEFYAAPTLNSGLPNAEFVELFNTSEKFIDLREWTLQDSTGLSAPFSQFILRPNQYVILTETDNGALFDSFGSVLEIGNFPSLNNGSDAIIISNDSDEVVHQIAYSGSSSGISTELINPNGPDFSDNNYGLSVDSEGGTPGSQNSIFDDTPDTTLPSISQLFVSSSTLLSLSFSEPVTKSSAEDLNNYMVDGDIVINDAIQIEDEVVELQVSQLTSTQVRTLTVNNIADLSGNIISPNSAIEFEFVESEKALFGDLVINEFLADPIDNSNDFVELYNRSDKIFNLSEWTLLDEASTSAEFDGFILRPDSYLIIFDEDATIDYSAFGDAISVPALTLNNSDDQIEIRDNEGDQIAFVAYTNQPAENVSSELINPEDPCISASSYLASTDATGSTPGTVNSVFDNSPDTTIPTIVSSFFDEKLAINFSETMDLSSVLQGSYGVVNLAVGNVSADEFPESVEIEFAEPLTSGAIYEMTISGLEDCWGNAMEETTITFGIGRIPSFNELIITEIQFDPDPSVGLPDVEFIEIYNTTSSLINIGELTYSDQTLSVSLPSATLNPMEYYVLTTTAGSTEFPVNSIGVSGFPSLSNSGEQLLISQDDELIFSIFYDPDWHDEEKSDGGYTLEMKDILNPCAEEFNWGSSADNTGGTPGASNALNENVPDNFGPQVIEILALSPDSVRITFDERIDPISEMIAAITFDPPLAIGTIDFNVQYPKTLFVLLGENLVPSRAHAIDISNVTDCNGNEVQAQALSFALPSTPETEDIVLSEVLFNPKTNGVDFVEVFNDSEKYLSLKNWKIGRLTEEGVSDEKEISGDEVILAPGEFLVLSTDSEKVLGDYPQSEVSSLFTVKSLPTFANDTGNVVLINSMNEVQELFHYDDDYHYQLLESTDGVSLERISYDAEVNDSNNWRSASSVQGFATPGYANSQAITQAAPVGKVEANPKVFVPGNSGSGRDFTTINYQFDEPGKFANITIYDQTGRLIKRVAEGALLSTSGFVRWDGTTNSGGLARLGYYVVLFEVYDSTGVSETLKETIVVGRDF